MNIRLGNINSNIPWGVYEAQGLNNRIALQNDSLSVQNEVWYTAGKGSLLGTVYALVIGWPKNGVVVLGSVQAHPGLTTIELIGLEKSLKYKQTESGLLVSQDILQRL